MVGIFMFICNRKLLPISLLIYYEINCNKHSHDTRNALNFHLPKIRTTLSQNSIIYQGPIIWNSIPVQICNSKSLNLFKTTFKRSLTECYIKE